MVFLYCILWHFSSIKNIKRKFRLETQLYTVDKIYKKLGCLLIASGGRVDGLTSPALTLGPAAPSAWVQPVPKSLIHSTHLVSQIQVASGVLYLGGERGHNTTLFVDVGMCGTLLDSR